MQNIENRRFNFTKRNGDFGLLISLASLQEGFYFKLGITEEDKQLERNISD
jgi:hypothetical protein